jgi:subfamily B ATP-binding cassette protein MsbA
MEIKSTLAAEDRPLPFGWLMSFVKPYKIRFALGIIFGLLTGVMQLLMIFGFSLAFSVVLRGNVGTLNKVNEVPIFGQINLLELFRLKEDQPSTLPVVIGACLMIPLLMLLRSLCEYLNKYCLAWVGAKMLLKMRSDVFKALLSQSPSYFNKAKSGNLMQTILNQTRLAQTSAVQITQLVTSRPFMVISTLGAVFYKDWFFASMALFVFPLCIAPIVMLGRRVKKAGVIEEQRSAKMLTNMQESIIGIRLVKAYAREDYECQRFNKNNEVITRNGLRWLRATEMVGPIVEIVASLGISIGLVYWWYKQRYADEFIVLVMALTQVYPPAKELSKFSFLLQKTKVAVNDVKDLLEQVPDILDDQGAQVLTSIKGDVHFENITFHYPAPEGGILPQAATRNLNLKLEAGKFYALVGPSGAGKSTLYSLLLRFYDPTEGRVFIDHLDIAKVTQQSLRERISLVSQDTFLFNDTIEENIRYGQLSASFAEVQAAAIKAHADTFINQVEGQYQAHVGDGGCNLSGGQKQRLSLARAFLKNAPILLLDEATSALDTETERLIKDSITELSKGRTVIAIAHRLSTILEADEIIVMQDGGIESRGSHQELLEKSNLYRNLYELQFKEPTSNEV